MLATELYLPARSSWPHVVPCGSYPSALNLADELLRDAPRGPRSTAILFRGERLSYERLASRVHAIAAGLSRAGVAPTDRVAFRLPNSPHFVALWLAIQWVGAIAVPIAMPYGRREIAHIVADAGASVLVCSDETRAKVEAARLESDVRLMRLADVENDRLAPPPPLPMPADAPALLTYITNASGPPKGVAHSATALLASADSYARGVLALTGDDVCIGPMSLAWAYGVGALLVFPLRFGAAAVLLEAPSIPLAPAIAASRATVLFNVPTGYRQLLQQLELAPYDLSSLRCAVSAGEPLPLDVAERWRARTTTSLLNGLGTTELTHIFISARLGETRAGLLGTPVAGYEARIVDGRFVSVPDGVPGRLAVRGPTGCLYWRNDELQRQTVHDGWTLTGDVCVRHADGSFEYVRRADDLIVSAGYKIAPREVEAVLASHPAVARSRVFAAPDPVRGAIAIAEVVPRDGVSITGLAETLQEYSREELASFKCPKRILVVGELVRR